MKKLRYAIASLAQLLEIVAGLLVVLGVSVLVPAIIHVSWPWKLGCVVLILAVGFLALSSYLNWRYRPTEDR